MTIASWISEFYKEPAKNFRSPDRTAKEAIEHSLKKWVGLLHLDQHGIGQDGHMLMEKGAEEELDKYQTMFDGDNCSLCHKFYDRTATEFECRLCPIAKMKRDKREEVDYGFACRNQYDMGTYDDNPKPMIELLEETLRWQETQDKSA
jgi:hypothetical protein